MSQQDEYSMLVSPIRLGPVELRNRVIMTPHGNGMATHEFLPTRRQAHYFAERAAGGTGLIVWGGSNVHLNSVGKNGRNLIGDRRAVAGYRYATGLVHDAGGKMFAQLSHQGRQQTPKYSMLPTISPSPMMDPLNRQIPKEMEAEDFAETLDAYADAASIAVDGGFDGVEIYAAHGYLLSQFLSPMSNHRKDEYGGSPEARARFPLKVLARVRDVVGPGQAVGLRLNCADFVDGGLETDDVAELVQIFERSGQVDYFSISGGTYHNMALWMGEMSVPPAVFAERAAVIRAATNLPVAVANRIATPAEAERILQAGQADLVGMTRALIADPEWVNKAAGGRADRIRVCTYSNQGCLARSTAGLPVRCIYNPAVSEEEHWPAGSLQPAAQPRDLLVVGAGPAGMEFASTAAERGHRVTLVDRSDRLGGQLNHITAIGSREGFGRIVEYYQRKLAIVGVDIRLRAEFTAHDAESARCDLLVLAVGSEHDRGGYSTRLPGKESILHPDFVDAATPEDVFAFPDRFAGQRMVIYDELSNANALTTAEYALQLGAEVTFVTPLAAPGQGGEYDVTTLGPQLRRLHSDPGRFQLRCNWQLVEAGPDGTGTLANVHNPAVTDKIELERLVLCTAQRARDSLYHALTMTGGQQIPILRIGDCVSPRRILDAVYEGHRRAREL